MPVLSTFGRHFLIDWSDFDTLLLDMDGTLLDLEFDDHFFMQYMPVRLDGSGVETRFHTLMESTRGTIQWYCTDNWREHLGFSLIDEMQRFRHQVRWRPGVTDFLRLAKKAGKKLIIATNAHPDVFRLKAEVLEIERFVDVVVSSHDYAEPKEAAAFWTALSDQHNLALQRCAFFDDSEAVLASAIRNQVGCVVGVDKPNSARPPRTLNGHLQIRDFSDLIPGLRLSA